MNWNDFDNEVLKPYEETGSEAKLFNPELKVFSYMAIRHIAYHAFKAGAASTQDNHRMMQTRGYRNYTEGEALALSYAQNYGTIDGGHHKMWVIDQMVRAITKEDYENFVISCEIGEDCPKTYEWDTGIAP